MVMGANENRRGRSGFWIRTSAIVIVLFGAAAAFHFQDHFIPPHAVTAAEARPIEGDTPFHQHVAQAGIAACGTVFPAMGQLLTQNAEYMVQSQWNEQDPNGHAIRAVVGMQFDTPEHNGLAIGVVLAAPVGQSCEAGAIRITPFEMSCGEVARRFLGGSGMDTRLQGLPLYEVADGSQVITVSAGENCVAVSIGYSVISRDGAD